MHQDRLAPVIRSAGVMVSRDGGPWKEQPTLDIKSWNLVRASEFVLEGAITALKACRRALFSSSSPRMRSLLSCNCLFGA